MANIGLAFFLELLITALFCTTMYNTLMQVREENRKLQAWQIWILFIPYISLVWNFILVFGMSNSIRAELEKREYELNSRPALVSGITYSVITLIISILVLSFPFMEVAQQVMQNRTKNPEAPLGSQEMLLMGLGILGLVRMIFFIQFWWKIRWYKNVLKNNLAED